MVLALDSSGEEILRLPGYGITGNSAYISNGMIVNENTPLVLYTEYEDGASDDLSLIHIFLIRVIIRRQLSRRTWQRIS